MILLPHGEKDHLNVFWKNRTTAALKLLWKAARSMVRGGESAPVSKGAEPHAQELAPPAAASLRE